MSYLIRPKELSKLGYHSDKARSLAITIAAKHCKHLDKERTTQILADILENPENWGGDPVWGKLAASFLPEKTGNPYKVYGLRAEEQSAPCKIFGGKQIDSNARQQMNTALRLPIAVQGALMPDAHGGYGLPIGAVLATENAVIPFGVGVDIGCRMALSIFDVNDHHLQRQSFAIRTALHDYTHFGMEGGLEFERTHEILDSPVFQQTPLLRSLHGKAARQLGSSGGGNHFVEFGTLELFAGNAAGLPAGNYTALLSHSGSRGLGANIAQHYTRLAMDLCKLPAEAQHLAWLDLSSEEGQEYWISMNLAGDYARACHDSIHASLARALGLQVLAKVENHHNFAWIEQLADGKEVVVHRKGATPAHEGELGIIPGSMATPGYLVRGKGLAQSLNSASHGAGRAMSRKAAKERFTNSGMKKMLSAAGVTLMGGSVEESPSAYKDIETVMGLQKELIDIEGRFVPKIVRMNKE